MILSPIEQSIKRKIEAVGKPLKDWDIQIYRGVLTGCNEAFIIDEAKRAEILSNCQSDDERERTEAIIRPILRGRDIRRYGYDWAGLYIVYIPWHFPLHLDPAITGASEKAEEAFKTSYPSVYNHLEGYKDTLKKRNQAETGIRYEWYALQRWGANYWEEFEKPKIVFAELSDRAKFYYDNQGMYPDKTNFIITGDSIELLYLQFNSPLIEYMYSKGAASTGVGTTMWQKTKIMELHMLPITSTTEVTIRQIFNEVITETSQENIEVLLSSFYALQYSQFNLTHKEILFIEEFIRSGVIYQGR